MTVPASSACTVRDFRIFTKPPLIARAARSAIGNASTSMERPTLGGRQYLLAAEVDAVRTSVNRKIKQVRDPFQENLGIADFESRSEEHTSELQSLMRISYAVFCLKKKKINKNT